MAIFSQYGTGQRVGFVLVCIGFAFCLIGSIAPYWITAQSDNDIDLNVGIWYYCVDWSLGEKCYSMYDTGFRAWIYAVRFFIFLNLLLGLLAGLVACCRCMCCSGGRTICHGVLSFLGGGFGLCAFGIFYNKTSDLLNNIDNIDSGWALGMFVVGSIMMVIASFVLCCAVPREPSFGMVVVPGAGPSVNVNVSNTNTNTNTNFNQYNAGGPIQSYEPLPHPHMAGYPPAPQQPYGVQQPYGIQQPYGVQQPSSVQQPMGSNNPPPGYDSNNTAYKQ